MANTKVPKKDVRKIIKLNPGGLLKDVVKRRQQRKSVMDALFPEDKKKK